MTKQSNKLLSIQVKLNGLSFCVADTSSKTILYLNALEYDQKLSPNAILNNLKEELSKNTIFTDEFETIQLIHCNELSTFVPKALYNEAHNADYLKFNSKILKTDFIASDALNTLDIVNVYVPYVNLNNYIFDTFGEFTYKHASTIFIDAISKFDNADASIYINVESNAMQLTVFEAKTLKLYNYFEFTTAEDFIYYILFTIEQLQLDAETVQLYFCGAIDKEDDLYSITYKYIRHVNFVTNLSEDQSQHSNTLSHHHFLLKHSL